MRKVALLGGLGYVVIFITGIFANFFVLEKLKVAGDQLKTFQNFAENQSLVLMAVLAFAIMVIFDVVLTWALCVLFKEQDSKLSQTTAWFRLINAGFFGVALYHLVVVLPLILEPLGSNPRAASELAASLDRFNDIWLIGLAFFGVHLILLSNLLKRSGRVAKLVPILLLIAGVGYIVDTALQFGYADYASIAELSALIVVLPGIVGELSLTGWLLFRAGKEKKSKGHNVLGLAS